MPKSPILFLVFNRPNHTKKVFESIREYKPNKIYISADGPRSWLSDEEKLCSEVRSIVDQIDWDCEIFTMFHDINLGCKLAVSTGISWFFENEENGIILEDDCLPHPDFFGFCNLLLNKYQHDENIWMISGNNFHTQENDNLASYHFSKYCLIWGWATWKRAWNKYDLNISYWPSWEKSINLQKSLPDKIEQKYWGKIFEKVYKNQIDTWDYSWVACVLYHNGLTIIPNQNLVTNIGFGPNATHTKYDIEILGKPTASIGQIVHPLSIRKDVDSDRYLFYNHFGGNNLLLKYKVISAINKIKQYLAFL